MLVALVALVAGTPSPPACAQTLSGRPLRTDAALTLASGQHAVEVGLDWWRGITPAPLVDDRTKGDLWRVPQVRYRLGLGRAELAVGGAAWQRFEGDGLEGTSEEVGDLDVWFKLGLVRQDRGRPALAVAFGGKLPNASDESGLGTDETDLHLQLLVSRAWGHHELRANVGLGILGDPLENRSQVDVLTHGVGGLHGGRHAVLWEVVGVVSTEDTRQVDSSTLRIGHAHRGQRVATDLSLLVGLREGSGDIGASAGVTFLLGAPRS